MKIQCVKSGWTCVTCGSTQHYPNFHEFGSTHFSQAQQNIPIPIFFFFGFGQANGFRSNFARLRDY